MKKIATAVFLLTSIAASSRFADPHPDASDDLKKQELVRIIEEMLAKI